MAPKLTRGTCIDGVIAYQDHSDPRQFHYLPARVDCILGDTLLDFEVTYWGVNPSPWYVTIPPDPNPINSVGGILAGRARLDISPNQRASISRAIEREFGISNPRLLPIVMSNITVQPVIAQNIVELTPNSRVTFPNRIQFGSTFSYLVNSVNSQFAVLAAGTSTNPTPRPSFSINVFGDVEFVGDPWSAKITCDLRQVWEYTRKEVNVSVGWGWFSLGNASYSDIVQKLERANIIKIEFEEGSGESKEGRELLEVGKRIFEEINRQAIAGEGFFRFEPNPSPQGSVGGGTGSPSWWGWNVSVNASYAHQSFDQAISFEETITYTGRVRVPVGSAMVLAVGCSPSTNQYFNDLQDTSNGCLTQTKINGLQARLRREADAKLAKSNEYRQKLEDGVWTPQKYREMMAILREISLTEYLKTTKIKKSQGFYQASQDEMDVILREAERDLDDRLPSPQESKKLKGKVAE